MNYRVLRYPLVWVAVGLLVGLVLGGAWPQTPLHAVATDRADTFAIATGAVDEDMEAIFFLDFLTGQLRAAVLGYQSGQFMAFYEHNVLDDLAVEPDRTPRFLMVTGHANLQRGAARLRPSRSVLYIAEVNSGRVAAYAIPWDPTAHRAGQTFRGGFIPLDATQFRTAPVRPSTE